jgi:hypothetical protein
MKSWVLLMQADAAGYATQSTDDEQDDLLETWMILEYCERGSLERAIKQGRFKKAANGQPEMVSTTKLHT